MNLNNQVEEKKDLTVDESTEIQANETEGTANNEAVKDDNNKAEQLQEMKETEQTADEATEQETAEKKESSDDEVPDTQVTDSITDDEEQVKAESEEQTQSDKAHEKQVPEKEQNTTPPAKEKEAVEESPAKDLKEVAGNVLADKTDDELAQYMETFKNYQQGDIIKGTIVGISDSEVLVDISYKSEGSIPISEFTGSEPPKKNTQIMVYYERSENSEGKVLLSKKKADFHLAFDKMNEIFNNNEKITGVAKKRVRGGMIVDVLGLDAFLPGSQISTKPVPNLDHFINKEMTFKIINLDKEKKNVIVSRRKVMDEDRKEKIDKLLDKIHTGAELDGEVKNITDYGAFIDLGGLDGLLHITDMTWGQINHPSEMLNISDKVKVKVIEYKPEEERISLGLKQLVPHPWENIETKYEEGVKVTVKVVSLTPYGAFVELEPGVEGLVHISEMSWTKRITNPKQVLNVGDTLDAIVLHVSKEDRKVSLGVKQMDPNPWLTIDERYPEGKIIKGKIKSLTPFGVFIEIEKDIDGLVHVSDISWTRRMSHPKEVLKKGQEVEAVVLTIDKHLHRVAMGIKQLAPDPWQDLEHKLPVNTEVQGTITNIIAKGVLVQVEVDGQIVEGFVPISHLAIPRLERPDYAFIIGDQLPMKVIELDMENRRLIFSVKAYLFSKEREVLQDFLAKYEPSPKKIQDIKEEHKRRNAAKKKAAKEAERKEMQRQNVKEQVAENKESETHENVSAEDNENKVTQEPKVEDHVDKNSEPAQPAAQETVPDEPDTHTDEPERVPEEAEKALPVEEEQAPAEPQKEDDDLKRDKMSDDYPQNVIIDIAATYDSNTVDKKTEEPTTDSQFDEIRAEASSQNEDEPKS